MKISQTPDQRLSQRARKGLGRQLVLGFDPGTGLGTLGILEPTIRVADYDAVVRIRRRHRFG